uniref:Uncharacterized protein n=1 Tax=Arundo donax TaxID=35708 RepID=A0A0A9GUJ9_ARUDO
MLKMVIPRDCIWNSCFDFCIHVCIWGAH